MSRAKWKGSYVQGTVLKKQLKRIWSRSSCIPFSYLNKKVYVYTGKEFRSFFVTEDKIGFKFGEFSFSRKKQQRNLASNKKKTK